MKKIGREILVHILIMLFVLTVAQINVNAERNYDSWTTRANMPTARYISGGVVEINNKIYAIGGYNGSVALNTVEEYDPETNEWTIKESMSTARNAIGVAVVNNKIYAIGGHNGSVALNTVEEYDPETNQWTIKESMPTSRNAIGVAVVNNKIYAVGGYNGSVSLNTVEEYDPETNQWTIKKSMPTSRRGLGVAVVDNRIYAIGGYCDGSSLNTVEEYNPVTNQWTIKENMPTSRYYLGVAVVNNRVYAIGGYCDGSSLNTVEEYDSCTDQWTINTNMPTARYGLGVAVVNNKIYAIGGYNNSGTKNVVEEYTPFYRIEIQSHKVNNVSHNSIQASWTSNGETVDTSYVLAVFDENEKLVKQNLWTNNLSDTINGLSSSTTYELKVKAKDIYENTTDWYSMGVVSTLTGYIDLGSWAGKTNINVKRFGLKAIEVNDKIYSIGGYSDNTYSNTTEEYNPNTDVCTTKANMLTPRRFLGLAEYNNKIYAVGGFNDNGMSNKVEEYDVETDQWKEVSSMQTPRHNLGVTAVEDKIYAIGGYAGAGATNIVEEYDIKTDTWIVKPSMPTPRYGLEAVKVNNKIYAIGGYTGSESTHIVEEYDSETNRWTAKANMPTARYGFAAEVVNNKIYVIGGITNNGSTNIVEEYDPKTDQWTQVVSMPTVRYHISAGEANNKIYVVGGYSSAGGYLNTVEEYTPPQAQNITLDLEADNYNLQLDSQFDAYVKIDGATNIYAQDIRITYDIKLFTLLDIQVVNQEKLGVYHSDQSTAGEVRYILASKGAVNGINGTEQLLKLSFKVTALEGKGDIGINSGLVADKNGIEITAKCLSKTFTIAQSISDVNRDGRISLGDLAITANLYNTMPEEWGTYNPDADLNGAIEEIDLSTIVDSILNTSTIVALNTTTPLTNEMPADKINKSIIYTEPVFMANDNIDIYDYEGKVMFGSGKAE